MTITRARTRQHGMTLIELLIVLVIIGIIAAVTVPGLMRSRISANEAAAIAGLRTLVSGETDYFNQAIPHTYADTLDQLKTGSGAGNVAFIDPVLGTGQRQGYTFELITIGGNAVYLSWCARATAISYRSTGIRSFFVNQSGTVTTADLGGAACATASCSTADCIFPAD